MTSVLIFLLVVGVSLYLFNTYIQRIDPKIKEIINVVVVLITLAIVISHFAGGPVRLPQIHW